MKDRKLKEILDNIPNIIIVTDNKGKILFFNKYAENIMGYSEKKVLGKKWFEIFAPSEKGEDLKEISKENKSFKSYENTILTKNNEKRIIKWSGNLIKAKDYLILFGEDKTEQRKIEQENEKFKNFFMNNLTANFILKLEGKLEICNLEFLNIFGFSSIEEAKDTNCFELWQEKEDRDRIISFLKNEKELENCEIRMKKKDGTPLNIIANLIGIFDKDGKLEKVQGQLLDETKIRKMIDEQILQTQKLEALGTLAGGIAHDFNNILNIITGYLDVTKKKFFLEGKGKEYIEIIERACLRGISLVNQLLTFAKRAEPIITSCNINEIIMDLGKIVYETFPKNIDFCLEIKEEMPLILGDPNQLYQAFLNLLINAKDAMQNGGKIVISTKIVTGECLKEKFGDSFLENYIEIKISDNGIGMDERTLKRIFEPFFTTKELGKGSGLGLAIVYSIIQNHKGFIDVISKIGEGTTFKIFLPIEEINIQMEEKRKAFPEVCKGNGELILIVEDEEMLLNLLRNILITNGYNTLEAKDGKAAIDLYRNNKEKISCIICDLGLPVISGEEVFKEIKNINPKSKIIFVSGLIDSKINANLLNNGAFDIIQKPYNLDELLYKLKMALKN